MINYNCPLYKQIADACFLCVWKVPFVGEFVRHRWLGFVFFFFVLMNPYTYAPSFSGATKKKQQIKNAVQFSIWGMYIVHRLQFSRTHRQCCAHSISEFGLFDSFLSYKFNAFCLHDSNKNKNTIKQHKINEKQQKKINNIFEKNVDSQKVELPKISTTLVWCLPFICVAQEK